MPVTVVESSQRDDAFELRGAGLELWRCQANEAMLSGPAETGKTISSLLKLHATMLKYPGAQGAIIRQTFASMQGSVLSSYEKKVLKGAYGTVVKPYGGEKPQWYDYSNGARVWVGGMDNPDKVLSSERDIVYVNQAEEISLDAWEYLLTRTTGRAGNIPNAILYGDCNPGPRSHWIKQRFGDRMFESRHEDNPTLFDSDGNILPQGIKSLAALDALTGARKQRLRYGRWVSAEGMVFENWDQTRNTTYRANVPPPARRIELIDFGYTHPLCWQNWHIDNDGNAYVVQELYATEMMVEDACKLINAAVEGDIEPEAIIADWDAEDRATFTKYRGYPTRGAAKQIGARTMIQEMNKRMMPAGNGRPRFKYCLDAPIYIDEKLKEQHKPLSSLDEVEGYIWNLAKDMPVKEWDHGMDDWRYGVAYLDLMPKPKPTRRPTSMTVRTR